MNSVFVVYALCFIFLYIAPAVWFIRSLRITDGLKELQDLVIKPQHDKTKNIVCITNNFDDFSIGLGKAMHGNYLLKILQRICADLKNGNRYNPDFYLSLYKKNYTRFSGNLFLVSHIAPIAIITMEFTAGDLFNIILPLQFIWYLLLIALQFLFAYNFDAFTKVFYMNWQDKLLNLDTIFIDELKDKLSKEYDSVSDTGIHKIMSELEKAFSVPVEELSSASATLTSAIKELGTEKHKDGIVTPESIINALDANFKRIGLLCESLESAAELSAKSYNDMHKFISADKLTIDAIHKQTDEFSRLRKTLADNINSYETATAKKLGEITATLETNVNKIFTTIDKTLTVNTQELSKMYEHFFDVCKTLNEHLAEEDT
jgi:hypothetical protein